MLRVRGEHHRAHVTASHTTASGAVTNSGWHNSPWFRRAAVVVAGASLALAFPKAGIAGLAWIAPGMILLVARGGRAFRLGYLAGFTHYLISLVWLLNMPVKFFPILGWIALAAYLALFPAAWTWACCKTARSVSTWLGRTGHALFCAAAWVAMEMIIARMFTGFPWNLLGASQLKLLPLVQIASVTGVYGVSFLLVWFSASILNTFDVLLLRPAQRSAWLKELALPILAVAAVYTVGLYRMMSAPRPERTLRIALVQPSIPQTMIWDEREAGTRFRELLQLTHAALTNKPALLIWPEAAVPTRVRDDEATARTILELARTSGAWFIVGSDDFDFRGTNAIYFNSAFLANPRGQFVENYRKRRLVIFGEYVPLIDWLPFIKMLTPITSGFTAGERPVTFDLGELRAKTSVLICFEDVFPHYAREHATNDVDFLVNITNDGWFGDSAEQWQHAASAAFRAVENGVPLVRCANNGVSCWIDCFGAIHKEFFENSRDTYRAGFKIVEVPLASTRAHSFYNRHGDWFGWGCVIVASAILVMRILQSERVRFGFFFTPRREGRGEG
jgi:apolipoprotein N-acyltransferase